MRTIPRVVMSLVQFFGLSKSKSVRTSLWIGNDEISVINNTIDFLEEVDYTTFRNQTMRSVSGRGAIPHWR